MNLVIAHLSETSSSTCCSDAEAAVKRQESLEQLLDLARDLCKRTQNMMHIPGMNKLLKSCQAEERFLMKVKKKKDIKDCHIKSTNLSHLKGIVELAERLPNVSHVLQAFVTDGCQHPVVVDVVCNCGYTWIKVIARKAEALHRVWAGQGEFRERSVTSQARLYATCAARHRLSYVTPRVLFIFTNGLTLPLARVLCCHNVGPFGVPVTCESLDSLADGTDHDGDGDDGDDDDDDGHDSIGTLYGLCQYTCLRYRLDAVLADHSGVTGSGCAPSRGQLDLGELTPLLRAVPDLSRVSLDITAMIAYVSNLCHGRSNYVFTQDVLTEQAKWERENPLLPKLELFMKGKELLACETAVRDFRAIIDTIGGPNEKKRADDLLERVKVIPDSLSERAKQLKLSHQVKDRPKIIFGTGDKLHAVTMSANTGFIRAAANQGVNFAVFLHAPRALTEKKEASAAVITPTTEAHSN